MGGGLAFADLTVGDASGGNTTVAVATTAEILAVVSVDSGNLLDETGFVFV